MDNSKGANAMFEVRTSPTLSVRGCFAKQPIERNTCLLTALPLVNAPYFTNDRRYPARCASCWEVMSRTDMCIVCGMEGYCSNCVSLSTHTIAKCKYLTTLQLRTSDMDPDIVSMVHLLINYLVLLQQSSSDQRTRILEQVNNLCFTEYSDLDPNIQANINQSLDVITSIHSSADSIREVCLDLLLRENCNGFTYWDSNYEKYGLAVVPSASYFNHACYPNAYKINKNGKIFIYALRDILVDEEILFSYVPHNYSTEDRQHILKTYFGFDCACIRCVTDTPRHDTCISILSSVSSARNRDALVEYESRIVHECGGVLFEFDGTGLRSTPKCSICSNID